MYDYIVIGSGYGGLSAASLLSKLNLSVLTLESHTEIGGCASFFKRNNFVFDVGATTLSGMLDYQPMGRLFKTLGINPKIKKLDPGVVIRMGDKRITRYSDKNQWIEESEDAFGEGDHKGFWNELYSTNEMLWELVTKNKTLPPASYDDIFDLAKIVNIKFMKLLPGIFLPIKNTLEKYNLLKNKNFVKLVDEQLLISTQNTSNEAPYLTSAIGLTYPSETYYPYGGMCKPLKNILDYYKKTNNTIEFSEKVVKIEKFSDGYKVKTQSGKVYTSKGIISNSTIWDLVKMTDGDIQNYFQKKASLFKSSWGAFTTYFAIKNDSNLATAYHQLHLRKKIPYCSGNSLYVSFSLSDDLEKAPAGWKTVTISTHTDVSNWKKTSKENYEDRKKLIEKMILEEFDYYFPEMKDNEKQFISSGTPTTFLNYTNRLAGFVGGIPHSIKQSFLQIPSNKTPFDNFYIVGDTAFAGQGTPAVVLGALNIYDRILAKI